VFVKGSEFRDLKDTIGHVAKESAAVQAVGGTIAFTEDITFSSSALINRYLSQLPEAAKEFLHELGTRYSSSELLEPLVAAADLKVLVVGETILDEYAYCETLGKSGKEPTLVGRSLYTDRFAGGVLACANHAASFCSSVTVLTCLGEGADQEPFIRRCLKDNVDLNFVTKKNTSTIVKKRYVEKCGGQTRCATSPWRRTPNRNF
jgi:hypothetical protein